MNPAACARVALALAAAIPAALVGALPAHACLFSNVASAYADGLVARRVTALPTTPLGEALWAPFAFQQDVAIGHVLRLREDMREVARSLGKDALRWRVRWILGDGTRVSGVAVAHAYRRPGMYKIEVQNYYDGSRAPRGWYDFDMVDVAVGPIPAAMAWMSATPQPGGDAAPAVAEPTPTPVPTGAARG